MTRGGNGRSEEAVCVSVRHSSRTMARARGDACSGGRDRREVDSPGDWAALDDAVSLLCPRYETRVSCVRLPGVVEDED